MEKGGRRGVGCYESDTDVATGDPLYMGRRSNGDGGWRKFVEVSMQMRYDAVRMRYVMLCNVRVVLIQRR